MPAVLIFIFLCIGLRLLFVEYQLHKRDRHEVEMAEAIAYHKHPEMEPVPAGTSSTYIYYITFHTDAGDILKLSMTPDQFYTIEEGSRGLLTWQGDRFWKFEQEE